MVSSLCFSPVFLPSLGDTAEQTPTAVEDFSTPLFDALMADPRFDDLRRCLDAPAANETPIEFALPGLGNHPVTTVLPEPETDEHDTETTMVIPVVDSTAAKLPATRRKPDAAAHDRELWIPDVGSPAHPRQHA